MNGRILYIVTDKIATNRQACNVVYKKRIVKGNDEVFKRVFIGVQIEITFFQVNYIKEYYIKSHRHTSFSRKINLECITCYAYILMYN